MKIATVRDVRNRFANLEAWVKEGQSVEIRKRGRPVAMLVPLPASYAQVKPDFASRRKAIWGRRIFTKTEVAAMRKAERENERG